MDISMANPQDHQYQPQQTLNLAGNISNAESASTANAVNSGEPVKRRPGRPKGSTKKNLLGTGTPSPPKIKRPVGRPRKDGFPAGSVGPSRVKRDRQPTAYYTAENGFSGVAYPPTMGIYPPPMPAFVPATPVMHIDPSLSGDEWSTLSRSDPNTFLSFLLAALAAPNPVSTAGPSVEEAFKSHLVSLAPSPNQAQPIPSLYSILKTFWLPSSPAYFSLTASASTARTPSEHRFLYWDPQPLVFNGISCPSCSAPLVNKGRISSGPIKVYDIEKPFFIIGCEYVCKASQCITPTTPEGRKFASTDSSILRSLPTKLQDEFPAKLLYDNTDAGSGPNIWNWKALGVSWSLWNMVHGALRAGLKKEVILHLIYSIQHGVPENEESKEEEEEGEEDVEQSEADHQPDHSNAPAQSIENGNGSNFPDAYSTAWKENTAVIDASIKSPPPQQSQAGTSTQSTGPPTQGFNSYPPYPFPTYAYLPHHIVNGQMVPLPSPPQPSASAAGASISHNNTSTSENEAPAQQQEQQSKRSPRHCCKCGSQECKGKGGRSFCMNACQDCGKLDCKGRNSRRPDKKCTEGWS